MSLDKSIESHKEHRKPFRGAKAIDSYCRNHGACGLCHENRLHNSRKRLESSKDKLKETEEYEC